eukprot:757458-Hanusia_phi.AAC.10
MAGSGREEQLVLYRGRASSFGQDLTDLVAHRTLCLLATIACCSQQEHHPGDPCSSSGSAPVPCLTPSPSRSPSHPLQLNAETRQQLDVSGIPVIDGFRIAIDRVDCHPDNLVNPPPTPPPQSDPQIVEKINEEELLVRTRFAALLVLVLSFVSTSPSLLSPFSPTLSSVQTRRFLSCGWLSREEMDRQSERAQQVAQVRNFLHPRCADGERQGNIEGGGCGGEACAGRGEEEEEGQPTVPRRQPVRLKRLEQGRRQRKRRAILVVAFRTLTDAGREQEERRRKKEKVAEKFAKFQKKAAKKTTKAQDQAPEDETCRYPAIVSPSPYRHLRPSLPLTLFPPHLHHSVPNPRETAREETQVLAPGGGLQAPLTLP